MKYLHYILFLLSLSAFGQQRNSKVIDSLLTSYNNDGYFNGVALVVDKGKVILHKGYGYSDRATTKVKRNDRFYIGSLTKQFTSALILLLQEDGKLSINDPIGKYLPEFKGVEYEGITIHHLLTHTSGLGSYTSFTEFNRAIDYTEVDFIKMLQKPLQFSPGEDFLYSNSGYYLLGIIAQRVGEDFLGNLYHDKIFEPLKMRNTAFDTTWLTKKVAKGYYQTIQFLSPMPSYSLQTLFSTGGLYSTTSDLLKWDQALYENKLLSDASKEIYFQPILNDYACGWYVKKGQEENGEHYERHFHGGWIKGYHAFILRRIPQKQLVILLDNHYSQEIQPIKNRIWTVLEGKEPKPLQPMLSNILYESCFNGNFYPLMKILNNEENGLEVSFIIDEFDINKVAYQLMEAERYQEAEVLFQFNMKKFPDSWNVYDSMGELQLYLKDYKSAMTNYLKSLELNPENKSGIEAVELIQKNQK